MNGWDPSALELASLIAAAARGPRRDGLFALWLTMRVVQDLSLDPALPERAWKRRLAALEARLSSLTLPPPLRRGLTAALVQLREPGIEVGAQVLSQLVAPVRETAGSEAAEAVSRAARAAKGSRRAPTA